MSGDRVRFRLYIAGEGPSSKVAIANLKALCDTYFPNRSATEIIDVFEEPATALRDGVMLTPLLCVIGGDTVQKFVGDLSKTAAILGALGIKAESS